jgi:hypothetical protein
MLRLLHCKLIILPSGLDANKWQQAMTLAGERTWIAKGMLT